MTQESKAMSFEEALKQLEAIVTQLERGEVSLDDAVAAYEKGSMISPFLYASSRVLAIDLTRPATFLRTDVRLME